MAKSMYFRKGGSAKVHNTANAQARGIDTAKSRYSKNGKDFAAIRGRLGVRLSREVETGSELTICELWLSY